MKSTGPVNLTAITPGIKLKTDYWYKEESNIKPLVRPESAEPQTPNPICKCKTSCQNCKCKTSKRCNNNA